MGEDTIPRLESTSRFSGLQYSGVVKTYEDINPKRDGDISCVHLAYFGRTRVKNKDDDFFQGITRRTYSEYWGAWTTCQDEIEGETLRRVAEERNDLKQASRSYAKELLQFLVSKSGETKPVTFPVVLQPKPVATEPKPPEWIEDHIGILSRLESKEVGSDEFEKAILIAEITDFAHDKIERLLNALGQFICNHRFATDEDTMILLGCAIRKYAMNMEASHFNSYAKWLEPTETKFLDSIIELELVKGVDWRLAYEPFSVDGNSIDELVEMMEEVCNQYSSRRLLLQKNFASIAIEANNAIVLLHLHLGDIEKANAVLDRAATLNPSWVAELVVNRLEETAGFMEEHSPIVSRKLQELLKA